VDFGIRDITKRDTFTWKESFLLDIPSPIHKN